MISFTWIESKIDEIVALLRAQLAEQKKLNVLLQPYLQDQNKRLETDKLGLSLQSEISNGSDKFIKI